MYLRESGVCCRLKRTLGRIVSATMVNQEQTGTADEPHNTQGNTNPRPHVTGHWPQGDIVEVPVLFAVNMSCDHIPESAVSVTYVYSRKNV